MNVCAWAATRRADTPYFACCAQLMVGVKQTLQSTADPREALTIAYEQLQVRPLYLHCNCILMRLS